MLAINTRLAVIFASKKIVYLRTAGNFNSGQANYSKTVDKSGEQRIGMFF